MIKKMVKTRGKEFKPSQDTEYWARVQQQISPAMLHIVTSDPCLHPGA
jgi:hypothetical protein